MKIPLHLIISVIDVFQASFLSLFLLINKRTRNTGNLILSGILFLLAIQIISIFAISVGVWPYFIHYHKHIFFLFQFSLLIPPMVYFYCRSLLSKSFALKSVHLVHLLPFIAAVIFSLFYLVPYTDFSILTSSIRFYSALIIVIQNLIYLILIIFSWKRSRNTDSIHLQTNINPGNPLLLTMISGLFLVWIANLNMFVILDVLKKTNWCPYTTHIYFYSIFIFINILLFLILSNPSFLSGNRITKYRKSGLNDSTKDLLYERMIKFMEEEKPYLNPNISLSELSEQLSIPPKDLSQLINEKTGQNFYDFINKYRIHESIELLKSFPKKEKYISEIFYSVGFNSKSTFNTAFKRITGFTPSEFRSTLE